MKEDNELISAKGVLMIIISTVIFPQIDEIQAYYNCKEKLKSICEVMALNGYGKSKNEIYNEINKLKTHQEIKNYVYNIHNKYIYDNNLIEILGGVKQWM